MPDYQELAEAIKGDVDEILNGVPFVWVQDKIFAAVDLRFKKAADIERKNRLLLKSLLRLPDGNIKESHAALIVFGGAKDAIKKHISSVLSGEPINLVQTKISEGINDIVAEASQIITDWLATKPRK